MKRTCGLATRDLSAAYAALRAKREGQQRSSAQSNMEMEAATAPFRAKSAACPMLVEVELADLSSKLDCTWFAAAKDVRDKLARAEEKLSQLAKAHQRRQIRVFEDDDTEVGTASQNVTLALRAGESAVAALNTLRRGKLSKQELEIRQNLQRKFAAQMQELSKHARQVQREHLGVMRSRQDEWDEELKFDLGRAKIKLDVHELEVVQIDDLQAAGLDLRCLEIRRLASSVSDLYSIYKDLSSMVIDQGSVLDRIDYNIEQVVDQAKAARGQLEQAEETQKRGRATKCMLFLAIADVVLLGMLFLKHMHRS